MFKTKSETSFNFNDLVFGLEIFVLFFKKKSSEGIS